VTGCPATAADPSRVGGLLTCENPNPDHEGQHYALDDAGQVRKWGHVQTRARRQPAPGRDFHDAYASGDAIKIAAARARYSDELRAAGFPGLTDPLDFGGQDS
jgi:hypothetical protein